MGRKEGEGRRRGSEGKGEIKRGRGEWQGRRRGNERREIKWEGEGERGRKVEGEINGMGTEEG